LLASALFVVTAMHRFTVSGNAAYIGRLTPPGSDRTVEQSPVPTVPVSGQMREVVVSPVKAREPWMPAIWTLGSSKMRRRSVARLSLRRRNAARMA
jgi:hypothetical protein